MNELEQQKAKLEILKLENENIKLQKETEKLEEEKSKVEAEKNELLKPWFSKTAWWSVITTFLIGAGGFYIALQTNIFGIQELKIEKKQLQDSINVKKEQLNTYKDSLILSADLYAMLKDSLQKRSDYFLRTEAILGSQLIQTKRQSIIDLNKLRRQIIDQQIDAYEKSNSSLRSLTRLPDINLDFNAPQKSKTTDTLQLIKSSYYEKFRAKFDSSYNKLTSSLLSENNRKIDSLKRLRASIRP